MNDHQQVSLVSELEHHWDLHPNGRCYCGCGGSTGNYFSSGGGHDARFAAHLLAGLRGNEEVAQVIRAFVDPERAEQRRKVIFAGALFANGYDFDGIAQALAVTVEEAQALAARAAEEQSAGTIGFMQSQGKPPQI